MSFLISKYVPKSYKEHKIMISEDWANIKTATKYMKVWANCLNEDQNPVRQQDCFDRESWKVLEIQAAIYLEKIIL